MAKHLTRWFRNGYRRRVDGANPAGASSARNGRRLSFERCEPRALLSATSALEAQQAMLQVNPDAASFRTVVFSESADLYAQSSDSDYALGGAPGVVSLLDSAVLEGGLVAINRFDDNAFIAGKQLAFQSFGEVARSGVRQSIAYNSMSDFFRPDLLGSADSFDSAVFFNTGIDHDGGYLDSAGYTTASSGQPRTNAEVLVPVTGGILITGQPVANADAIFLAMRPAMQPFKPAASTKVDAEGGIVLTPVRRPAADAFVASDASSDLAAAWKARRSLAAVGEDDGADKLRARAVALEVGSDIVASADDLRSAALARDAAFNSIEALRSAHRATGGGGDSVEASKVEREGSRRASRKTAEDAAPSREQIPADNSASTDAADSGGNRNAVQDTSAIGQSHGVGQSPVSAASDESASLQRSAGLQADESRPRMAAGVAAFLAGGLVLTRRRRAVDSINAAQLPPRRKG